MVAGCFHGQMCVQGQVQHPEHNEDEDEGKGKGEEALRGK